jgi:hypothetical protein
LSRFIGAELVATIAITRDATTVFPKPRFSNFVLKSVPFPMQLQFIELTQHV